MITREEILTTKDWVLSTYMNGNEGYFWIHKNILEDCYTFEMKIDLGTGFTTITELSKMGNLDLTLFNGYIKTKEDLEQVIRLCDLREI